MVLAAADYDLVTITDLMEVKKEVRVENVQEAIKRINDLNPTWVPSLFLAISGIPC